MAYTLLINLLIGMILTTSGCFEATQMDCGTNPDIQRTLLVGRLQRGFPASPFPGVRLIGTYRKGNLSEIMVRVIRHDSAVNYVSHDKGVSWVRMRDQFKCTQYNYLRSQATWTDCTLSRASSMIHYWSGGGDHDADMRISTDGGVSWSVIHPQLKDGSHLGKCWIYATGIRDPNVVYAEISAVGVGGFGKSDDNGRTFTPINQPLFESRADPALYIKVAQAGANPFDKGLFISRDYGATWNSIDSASSLFSPLYVAVDNDLYYRNWRMSDSDKEILIADAIQSIESDPGDRQIYYIFSRIRGIYRTLNGGNSFTILPLANDKLMEIDAVAVDPVDGYYLYAVLGGKELYRSSDHGCTWKRIDIPGK